MTKIVMTRGQVLQLSCCNEFGLSKGFYAAIENFDVSTRFG